MLVKVCGITTLEAAEAVAQAGADFIGFVFAPSKRRISPDNAAKIAQTLPKSLKKVGVFVNESAENINYIAKKVGLDYIQLHGDESADFASSLPFPVIKAFPIDKANASMIHRFPCDYYLIDSPAEEHRGGSGKTFNWEKLNALELDHGKLILAGGLTVANVQEAVTAVNPIGIDVSSGVETDGKKDIEKIKQFVALGKEKVII